MFSGAGDKRPRDQQKQGKALREEAAKWLVRIATVAKTRAFLILRVAEDDSAVVLADFNGHNPIVALSSLEHGDSKVFRDLSASKVILSTMPCLPYQMTV